jgi:hypothetical protein
MRTIILALCITASLSAYIRVANKLKGLESVDVQQLKALESVGEFASGFALSARVLEKVPDVLSCGASFESLYDVAQASLAKIKTGNFDEIVHAIQELTVSVHDSASNCGESSLEAKDYIREVLQIVKGTNISHNEDPQFRNNAGAALYKYAEVVGRDAAEVINAKGINDWFTIGLYLGDITRLALWGEPNP